MMYVFITTVVALGLLWGSINILQMGVAAQRSSNDFLLPSSKSLIRSAVVEYPPTSTLVLAAYQAWFGLDSHNLTPYISTDTAVISGHITAAQAQGIDGFVVDWYGPGKVGLNNTVDRKFIDEATRKLFEQSKGRNFYVALMYDENAISNTGILTTAYQSQVISDLLYAKQNYFTRTTYLSIITSSNVTSYPVIFVFPYDTVDPYVDWAEVRQQLGTEVILLDKDPDLEHNTNFDGFYAWVQPSTTTWKTDGTDCGQGYLEWFYKEMNTSTYTNKIIIGGVWPGFDDTLAGWREGRYMWRRCGQTWRDTWTIANQYDPPIVMIDTWNDFEEGTDIEYGIGECLMPYHEKCALSGEQVVFTHTLAIGLLTS